ncbi:MAG: dihydroorotase family protein, partial [Acetanaerobacterium sp.]
SDAARFQEQRTNLSSKAYIDFAMWALCLGKINNDDLGALDELGAAAFKFFWGYAVNKQNYGLVYNYKKGDPNVIPPLSDGEIYTIFEEMARIKKPLAIHAENASLIGELVDRVNVADYKNEYEALLATRPAVAEETIVATALSFARVTGAHLHILHMSAKESVALLREAKARGVNATGETAPHYLTLTSADFDRIGTTMKGYPPVRYQADQDALWQGLRDGTVDSIGSDHAPHTAQEKNGSLFDIPAGMCCIETTVPLLLDAVNRGRLSENRLAAVLSENTAKLYGIYPQKGSLIPGTDADITIVDFNMKKTLRSEEMFSKSKTTAFDGFAVQGVPVQTIVRGKTLARNGVLTCEESTGRFIAVGRK